MHISSYSPSFRRMGLIDAIHSIIDRALSLLKLVQNREIGWQTVNRKSGAYRREQQPILKKLKLLFLFSPLMEWIDRTHLLRLWIHSKTLEAGKREASKASAKQIRSFVDFYDIDMNDFEPSSLKDYETFDDFFVRQHASGSRPIYDADDGSKAIIVADSRVVVYPTLHETKKLWIKGKHFSIEELVLNKERAKAWNNCSIASFRLSPQDYHRYHSPVSGTVKWFNAIGGDYYQVDPICLSSRVDILTRNARCCIGIDTEEFGSVLFVAIGATDVGTVEISEKFRTKGSTIRKGDEVGLFQFGGSSIIVAFQEGRIYFDKDLLGLSRQRTMVDVEVGMSLGKAVDK